MATENVNIGINVVGTVTATTNLAKVQNSVTQMEKSVLSLNKAFDQMKGAFTVGAFTAVVTKINQYALGIQQASAATGVAMDTVSGFASAVAQAGGNANIATGDVIDFVAGLDAAKQGASGAQIDLAKVGISLRDLSKLSNQDLFKKTVDGLAKIEDASTRNRLALALLGKSFKDVDIRTVAGNMATGGGPNIGAIQAAAEAQKNLNKQLANLGEALINVAEPLNKLLAKLSFTTAEFENLIKIIATAAGAYFIFTRGLTGVTSAMNGIMTSLRSMGGVFTWFLVQFTSIGNNFAKIFTNMGRAVINVGAALGIFAAGAGTAAGVLGSLAAIAANVLRILLRFAGVVGVIYTVVDALSFLEKKFIGTNYIDKFFEVIAINMEKVIGFIPGLSGFAKMMEDARKGITGGTSKADDDRELAKFDRQAAAMQEQLRKTNQIVDANRGIALAIDQTITSYARTHALQADSLAFANKLIGKTDEEKHKLTEMETLRLGYMQQKYDLEKQFNDLKAAAAVGPIGGEEQTKFAAFAAQYQDAQSRITAGYDYQRVVVNDLIDKGQGLNRVEAHRAIIADHVLWVMQQQEAAMDAINAYKTPIKSQMVDIQFAAAQTGKNPLQQQMAQINEDARKAAEEAAKVFAAAPRFADNGDGLTPERMAELQKGLDDIAASYRGIADAQMANVEASRTWQAGWKDAFDKYLDNATNAATKAGEVFGSITSNMNSAIDTFVTKGTFSFKSFATSIIQDMLKIEMKAQASQVLKALFGGGSGGILATIFGGGQYAASSYAGMVGAGTFPAMAGGGQPVPNKATLVGEKGPELFVPRSAGTVIPNDKMAASAQPVINNNITNNTYQVSAIDAKSVAQLFAENRKTLLGTVRMAEREQPYAR